MMEFKKHKPHQAYRESGIEWIGNVPIYWAIVKIKYVYKEHNGNGFPEDEQGNLAGEIPFFKVNDINKPNIYIEYAQNYISCETLEKYKWNKIPKHSIITAKIGEALKKNHRKINLIECIIDNNCLALEPKNLDYNFGYFLLKLIDFNWFANPGAVPSLSNEKLRHSFVAIPPISEQQQIASFLDHKTSKIDRLIQEKQELIELLKKKKTALITKCVTKGLDDNVEMKDSGIEWIGQVPKHWEVKRIKHLGSIKYGLGEPPPLSENGIKFIRATDIYRGKIMGDKIQTVNPEFIPKRKAIYLKTGDILIVRSGAYTGDSAIIPNTLSGSIAGYDMVLRINNDNSKFISYALLSRYILEYQIYLAKIRAAQPHLNAEELGLCVIVMPSREEQAYIADCLDTHTLNIENSIQEIQGSIELLQQYRTSLITHAVTGKIDVRGWNKEETDHQEAAYG